MTVTVQYINKNASVASGEVAKRMQMVKSTLIKQGVAADAMQTKDLSITTNTDYKNDEVTVYTCKHSLFVVSNEVKNLGALFDAAIAAGASSITNMEYVVENKQQLQEQAMRLAVQDACRKAAVLTGISPENLLIKSIEDNTSTRRGTLGGWYAIPPPVTTEIMLHSIPIQASAVVEFTF